MVAGSHTFAPRENLPDTGFDNDLSDIKVQVMKTKIEKWGLY